MIRCIALSAAVLTVAGVVWGADSDKSRTQPAPTQPDRSFGTSLQWESKIEAAAKKAERERKLLMVLAVAGHFEDPFFTWNNAQTLRVQALAKPEVGDFLTKNFVSVFDKVGTFQVNVDENGRPRRNGGNVAAFFCTPKGYVIHVAAGPRTGEAFLAEARWAAHAYAQIMSDRTLGRAAARFEQSPRIAAALREAHSEAFKILRDPNASATGNELVLHEPPANPKLRGLDDAGRRQRARVHQLLMTNAYEPLASVGPQVYSNILGEIVTSQPVQLSGEAEAKQGARTGQSLVEFFAEGGAGSVAPPAESPPKPPAEPPAKKTRPPARTNRR